MLKLSKAFFLLCFISISAFSQVQKKPAAVSTSNTQVFKIVEPDFKLSPHTGMNRKHWKDAAIYLLEGAFSYVKTFDDPMKFPKQPGKSYPLDAKPNRTELLEGFCRTLFMAAPLLKEDPNLTINNIKVADYYRYNLVKLTDPKSNTYIGPRPGDWPNQNLVEFGGLSVSLFSIPELMWDPLTAEQKAALSSIMISYGDGPTVPNNWKFFNIMILSFYKSKGYSINEPLLEDLIKQAFSQYSGDGWYHDNPALDYYSMWGFQMYGMLWSEFFGKKYYPEYARQFKENFSPIKSNYPHMFSENGEMIMWGRSISYRFGATIPLALTGFENDPATNYGWMRRICSGSLLQFLQNPDLLEDRIPTLGFYGAFEPVVQMYSCRGSVFWMSKAFLSLLLPENNAFWTAKENEGDWEKKFSKDKVYNNFLAGTNLLITDYPAIGAAEIRSIADVPTLKKPPFDQYRNNENYNRLAYNSAFPWQADGVNGEVAMSYVFKTKDKKWEPAKIYKFKKFVDGIYYRDVALESNADIGLSLADIPLPNGMLRVDKNISKEAVQLRLGHYSLPKIKAEIKSVTRTIKGNKVTIIDNGVYQLALVQLTAWGKTEVVKSSGLHPVSKTSSVINVSSSFVPVANKPVIYATLMLWKKSGQTWSDSDLMPVAKIKQESGDLIHVTFKNGDKKTVKFN